MARAAGPRQASCVLLPAVLLCLQLAAAAAADAARHSSHGRRLLIRPLPSGAGTCRNTYQGPRLMADDKGKVCDTKDLDFFTGCCKAGDQHACAMCNTVDSCCATFEHCVSCCLAPGNKPEERRQAYWRVPNHPKSGTWDTVFEYCMAVCRTHVFSTSHENAYIGPRHHCFSKLGKPLLSPPLPPGALDGVTVLLGAAGSSCDGACEASGLSCSPDHLHLLNSCDRLREAHNCEAGCVAEEHAGFMPAAVDAEAPKANRPALCVISSNGTAAGTAFPCDASENYMKRLCPCLKAGTAKAASSSSTSSKTSSSNSSGGSAGGTAPSAQQQQQQQGPAKEGPDQLGATLNEGTGGGGGDGGDADVEAREYQEDPLRSGEGE